MLTKGAVTAVREEAGGNLAVEAVNTLLGPDIELGAELVVLSTGIVPVTARPIGVVLKYVTPAVEMWKAPACNAAIPSATSAARASTRRAFSAP